MQVTSNYYRSRSQLGPMGVDSLALLKKALHESHPAVTTKNLSKPLSPSSHTLRCLANLRKSKTQHRVA